MDMKRLGKKVSYDPNRIIGNGSYAIVYEGLYENTKKVAVKRILRGQVDEMLIKEEVHIMLKADDHPNILRYLCCKINDDFLFIVTEWCVGTLKDLVEGPYKGPLIEDKKKLLRQLTHGLSYLHHLGIIHRDIKPTNILIFAPELARNKIKPQIKLADFGLSKIINKGSTDLTNSRGISQNGTRGWMAPEFILNERYNSKMDIFPLGCVFGYTLTEGEHIFGEDPLRQQIRIEDRLPMVLVLNDLKIHLDDPVPAFELIKSMAEIEPSKRPTAEEVLNHKFFTGSAINWKNMAIISDDAAFEVKTDKYYGKIGDGGEVDTKDDIPAGSEVKTDLIPFRIRHIDQVQSKEFHQIFHRLVYRAARGLPLAHIQPMKCTHKGIGKFGQLLINGHFDINICVRGLNGWNPMHILCMYYGYSNLMDLIRLLTERGVDINAKTPQSNPTDYCAKHLEGFLQSPNGSSPLILLCRYYKGEDLIDLIRFLIEKGADINSKSSLGFNALHTLCSFYKVGGKMIELIQFLLENGLDATSLINDGRNVLHLLCENYDHDNLVDLIRLFIDRGVNINCKEPIQWKTPLHYVCKRYRRDNLIDVIKLFIENGVDSNAKCKEMGAEISVLEYIFTCYKKDNLIDIARLLIEKGADIHVKYKFRSNLLHVLCSRYKHSNVIELMRLLIESGISVTENDHRGWNALHILSKHYKHDNLINLVHLLIENGIDVIATTDDYNKWNSLHILCQFYNNDNLIGLIECLLQNGVDINVKDFAGWNMLHHLCKNWNNSRLIDLIFFLLRKGIDKSAETVDGWNPLHFLCANYGQKDLFDLIQLLLKYSSEIIKDKNEKSRVIKLNAKTKEGYTAFYILTTLNTSENKENYKAIKLLSHTRGSRLFSCGKKQEISDFFATQRKKKIKRGKGRK